MSEFILFELVPMLVISSTADEPTIKNNLHKTIGYNVESEAFLEIQQQTRGKCPERVLGSIHIGTCIYRLPEVLQWVLGIRTPETEKCTLVK